MPSHLTDIILFTSVIPFVFLVRKINIKVSKWFKFLIIVRFLSDVFCYYFKVKFDNVYPIFHISVLLETICYFNFFKEYFLFKNKILLFSILVFLIISITESYLNLWDNNYWSTLYSSVMISTFSFVFLLRNEFSIKGDLVIIIPTFIFSLTMAIYVVFENIIRNNYKLFDSIQPLILLFILFLNLSFTYSLWLKRKT